MNNRAIVISPFATFPLDAGHRRRTFQVTQALKEAGYRVTFLLFAFENTWYWNYDDECVEALRKQWDDVIIVHAGHHVGLPPKNGVIHELDEWWDPQLESALKNIVSRRWFDVAVVHNVWLSKALDFFPRSTARVIETHDIFWKRTELFRSLGLRPEFFTCDKAGEVFGLNRAQVVSAIQSADGAELVRTVDAAVVDFPFFDNTLKPVRAGSSGGKFLKEDTVRFGYLASDNIFNISGLNEFVQALERIVAQTFSPVELVVGGKVGEHVQARLKIERTGPVKTEADFYSMVDVAIAPVFHGTGFKIKTADALALELPLICSEHAAIGTTLDSSAIVSTPVAMAHLVAEIALTRPDLLSLRRSTSKATADLRARALTGKIEFLTEIADSSTPLLIDLSSATIANDPLVLLSWLPALRKFAELKPVVALLNKQLCKDIGPSLPLGVSATTVGEFRTRRRWKKVNVVDVLGKGQPGGYGCREADVVFHDQRWSSSRRDQIKSVLGDAPLILPGVLWEPSALFVRKAHGGLTNLGTNRPKYSVFWDSSAHSRSSGSRSNSHYLFYNVQDWAEAQRGVLSLIEAPPHHVVWAAMTGNGVQKAVMACCALQGHRYQGAVDVQFHNDGSTGLPAPRDLDGRFRNCAEITISAMNSHL